MELADSRETLTGADLWKDALNHRLHPGDGEFHVPTFVGRHGRSRLDGMLGGVEVISEAQRQLPLAVAVTRIKPPPSC